MNDPSTNGANGEEGRDPNSGRFTKGNAGGPGNPRARHARQLRERLDDALFKTCSPDRLLAAIDACLKLAEAGDVAALKLLMERISGRSVAAQLIDQQEVQFNRITFEGDKEIQNE